MGLRGVVVVVVVVVMRRDSDSIVRPPAITKGRYGNYQPNLDFVFVNELAVEGVRYM